MTWSQPVNQVYYKVYSINRIHQFEQPRIALDQLDGIILNENLIQTLLLIRLSPASN